MNKNVVTLRPAPKATHEGPENQHFSYVDTGFDERYEASVRALTRDVDPMKERNNKAADKLVYAFITVNKTTGVASEFGWASGRQDVHIIADLPTTAVEAHVVETRHNLIEKLKVKYYDRGFAHDEYEGGFREFAQNFERSTGRRVAPEIAALCSSKLFAAA